MATDKGDGGENNNRGRGDDGRDDYSARGQVGYLLICREVHNVARFPTVNYLFRMLPGGGLGLGAC